VVQCNNRERVLLASHQLVGPIADWWDAYVEAHEEPDTINWNEFKMAFRSHHVPCTSRCYEAQEEGVSGSEVRIHDGEQVCHSFHVAFSLSTQ
jgi:hypothetical protein